MNCLKTTLLFIKVQVTCTKNYTRPKVKKNKYEVYAIKKVLDKIKKLIQKGPENKNLRLKKTKG